MLAARSSSSAASTGPISPSPHVPGKKLDEKEQKLRERLFLSEGMAYRKEEMKQQSDSGTDAIILPGMLLLFFFLCTGISVFWGRKDRRR